MQARSTDASDTARAGAFENKIWYLKRSRLFERAAAATIAGCEGIFVQQTYKKGAVLFRQGDEARTVFLVKRGTIRIARTTLDGKDLTIAILGDGSIFGEEVVFSNVERRTQAVCMTDALLCWAKAEHIYGLISKHPGLALNIAKYVNEQRDGALAMAEDVAFLGVAERLTRLFARLAREHGRPIDGGTLLDVRLTQADLASLIGSTRETVSLKLGELVRERHIRFEGRDIVLLAQRR